MRDDEKKAAARQRADYIRALREEREGYIRSGRPERVQAIDDEIARVEGRPEGRSESEPPRRRRA